MDWVVAWRLSASRSLLGAVRLIALAAQGPADIKAVTPSLLGLFAPASRMRQRAMVYSVLPALTMFGM